MCGIAGAISFGDFKITESYLNAMNQTIKHRGPDGDGVWLSPTTNIGLAHTRLSIIDLSNTAAQPMSTSDNKLWLSFNGEIYNHAEIRKELNQLSTINWKTDHSDTEVILYAFKQWGIECLSKFRGMFAFALWDEEKKQLWLARDRIGIKPLYYSHHNNRLVFASEIKALLQDKQQKRSVNEQALYHYLSFLTTPAPQTLFDGIKKLPGGYYLKVEADGSMTQHEYWDVWDHVQPQQYSNKNEKIITDKILEELRTSVALRKISDVPVGVFLSGGIDSSTNAALFSEGDNQPVNTFSIGYDTDYKSYSNELHYAKKMAEEVGANYHEKLLNVDDLIDFLPKMIYLQDEPIADPVCVPVYYVSKLARDNGTIVCQVGEGADELYWGYESWKVKLRLQQYSDLPLTKPLKKLGMKLFEMANKQDRWEYELLRRGANDLPIFWGGAEAFTEYQKQQLLSPRLKQKFSNYTSWDALKPLWDKFQKKAWDKSTLHWMTYLDLNFRLPELLLMRVDKMSMGVSLEARVPFLDHKFVELALSIPAKLKTRKGISKYLLKSAVRGIIPDELIDRKKQGFGVPVYEWFFDKLGTQIQKELLDFCDQTDYFDKNTILHLIETKQATQCWYLFNFVLWWKMYIKDYQD